MVKEINGQGNEDMNSGGFERRLAILGKRGGTPSAVCKKEF
jgi:hypothetical protein